MSKLHPTKLCVWDPSKNGAIARLNTTRPRYTNVTSKKSTCNVQALSCHGDLLEMSWCLNHNGLGQCERFGQTLVDWETMAMVVASCQSGATVFAQTFSQGTASGPRMLWALRFLLRDGNFWSTGYCSLEPWTPQL